MEIVKLIGVLIVIAGFILKLDTLAMVVTAGLATGLVAGMSRWRFWILLEPPLSLTGQLLFLS